MAVMNTLYKTQILGAESMIQINSTLGICVALVAVAIGAMKVQMKVQFIDPPSIARAMHKLRQGIAGASLRQPWNCISAS